MSAATGAYLQIGMDPSSTTSTENYEGIVTDIRANEDLLDAAGLRGTRSHISDRIRQNTRAPGFTLQLQPNSVELDLLLPRIFGAAEVADSFALAETLPTFVTVFDFVNKRYQCTGCKVDKATFSSSQGGPLNLELTVECLDIAEAATAFTVVGVNANPPYIHSDLVLSVAATPYKFRDVKITVDNLLKKDRFFNSQTRISLPETDRVITWDLLGPYGDNQPTYQGFFAGAALVATWTQGARSLAITSAAVNELRVPPQINGRDEIMLAFTGIARKTGVTPEMSCVNDSTP